MELTHTRETAVAVRRMALAPTVNKPKPTGRMISGLWLRKASWRVLEVVLNNRLIHRDMVMDLPHRKLKAIT